MRRFVLTSLKTRAAGGGVFTCAARCATSAASSSEGSSSIFATKEFLRTAPLLLLLDRIEASAAAVVTSEQLSTMATACKVTDVDKTVDTLAAAGVLVKLSDGGYHLRPQQLVADVSLRGGNPFKFEAPFEAEAAAAAEEENKMRQLLEPAIHRASRTRQMVWGGAMLFSGAQLAIISRLTYFDLDWDIMEPVSYFIGTGTALCFYFYMLWYRREHSYAEFDRTHLPKWLKQRAPAGFDWGAYYAACERLDAAHLAVEAAKKWASTH